MKRNYVQNLALSCGPLKAPKALISRTQGPSERVCCTPVFALNYRNPNFTQSSKGEAGETQPAVAHLLPNSLHTLRPSSDLLLGGLWSRDLCFLQNNPQPNPSSWWLLIQIPNHFITTDSSLENEKAFRK